MVCMYHNDKDKGALFCYQTFAEWQFILFCYISLWTGIGLFMCGMLVVHQKYGVQAEWSFLVIFLAFVFLLLIGLLLGERERRKVELLVPAH